MLIILLCIVGAILLAPVVIGRVKDWGVGEHLEYLVITIAPFILLATAIFALIQINLGESTYTGYIYSAEDILDKSVGHIRFSETAGKDSQPSFCVAKGSEESKKLKELAGSGKKVRVTVPEGFVVNMWYGQCGLQANIEEVKND